MNYLDIYEDLKKSAIKELEKKRSGKTRVILGYSICSVSVGASEVLRELQKTLLDKNLNDVIIETTGCNGLCHKEPLLNIITPDNKKYTYELVTPEKARAILISHVLYDDFISEYLIKERGVSNGIKKN